MWEIYAHFSLLLLSIAIWAVRYKHLRPELKLLGLALLASAAIEGYAAYLILNNTRNLHVYHILTPIQYALYSLIFYRIAENGKMRKIIRFSIPAFMVASALITVYVQGTREFNSYALSLKNVLLACWALLYYRDIFIRLKVDRLDREPMFWVSTGLLFYSLGSFFVYGLMNHLLKQSYEMAHTLYYITLFLGYLLYATFIVAFMLQMKASASRVH